MSSNERQREQHGSLVGGAVLVALGVAFLIQHGFNFAGLSFPWPFFVIGPGLLLFAAMIAGGRGAGTLAIPASIVTTIGLLLLYQSTFDRFETWAYAWALLPFAGGIGSMIAGRWDGNAKAVREGRGAARSGLGMFLISGAFFEIFIFRNDPFGGHAWTIALILVGAFLIVRALIERRAAAGRWDDEAADDDTPAQEPERVFPY